MGVGVGVSVGVGVAVGVGVIVGVGVAVRVGVSVGVNEGDREIVAGEITGCVCLQPVISINVAMILSVRFFIIDVPALPFGGQLQCSSSNSTIISPLHPSAR